MTLRLTPYLMMEGNAKEAIQFYEKTLDATIVTVQTYGEVLPTCPSAIKEHVGHAMLKVGETDLIFSDTPGPPIKKGNQVMISISTNDVEKTKRIFEALQLDGKVNQPLEETPFSPAFGNVTDKFGVTFQIVTEGK
ncbi:VOC family protein [Virgibacillus dakarensis]|uniref:VOC family protein n=1 Tax=Virgibacillus dakarensis TaxID=1917889 RepID=UPI000B453971|nr:VOC family protein [Virgibacillus dakarensis]MBT2214649.1 VOC family protein [Virgibacillus dakarensis]MTW87941.1 VOC family protein [Virgibacillus dakarensis]